MQAKDIMTTRVITVPPEASAQDVARLLLKNNISAVPVVDAAGIPLGMVSEGDLTGRNIAKRAERSDWWLGLLAEGETMAPDFLDEVHRQSYRIQDIMSFPVISVNAATDICDIAKLLTEHHVKRVPVLENGHIAGIVSRADLVRAITLGNISAAAQPPKEPDASLLFQEVEKKLHMRHPHASEEKPAQQDSGKTHISAKDFQTLMMNFRHASTLKEQEEHHRLTEQHKKQVAELINHHVDEGNWQAILHNARDAAERGEKEYMMLRFPNELCTDGGRAINVAEDGWHNTLQGEAAEMYARWEKELKPQGFRFSTRIMDYPGGFPGDVGIFLVWGSGS